jgi:hypothetical protein
MGSTSTTYSPTGITTGMREDLSDVITNIAPTDTVFLSNIGKEKVKGRYHEWLQDTLTTAANCAVSEGNDASLTDIAAQTRVGNYTQIAAKWFAISDTLEEVDKAGRKSEIAYQTGLFLKMLARDMEYGLLNNSTATSTDPRSAKGVKGWITTNTYGKVGFTSGTASTTLTETIFNDGIQLCWTEGGNPNMVLVGSTLKRRISAFEGNGKITTNMDAENKKIILSVDYYESDYGVVKIYASRFLATDDTSSYESCLILEKEKWALGTLQPLKTEKLAKTGLSTKIQMSTEYTLIARQQKANAWIKNCNIA